MQWRSSRTPNRPGQCTELRRLDRSWRVSRSMTLDIYNLYLRAASLSPKLGRSLARAAASSSPTRRCFRSRCAMQSRSSRPPNLRDRWIETFQLLELLGVSLSLASAEALAQADASERPRSILEELGQRFARDSPLEEAGFEPSVPLGIESVPCWWNRKSGRGAPPKRSLFSRRD
jgi:hypothetical protein